MNVLVEPGFAICSGGMKLEETQRTLAIQAADTTYDRIDTVVLRWNDNDSERICDFYIIPGTPASSPVRPALTRTESIWELGLADLFIAKSSTEISNQRITDTRYESERCGVTSAISEFDTSTLYQQVQADLAEFKEEEQAEFVAWFENIKNQLSEDAAGNLQNQIDKVNENLTASDGTTFRFGVNEEGEFGYIVTGEDGADTVIPFSNAKKLYEALQYSGLVTEDMSFDEMCAVLAEMYPETFNLLSIDKWTDTNTQARLLNSKSSDGTYLYLTFGCVSTNNATTAITWFTSEEMDLTNLTTLTIVGTHSSNVEHNNAAFGGSIQLLQNGSVVETLHSYSKTGNYDDGYSVAVNIKKDISNLSGKYTIRVNGVMNSWDSSKYVRFIFTSFNIS